MSPTTTRQLHRLKVDGMDCFTCEQLLIEHVERLDGVMASCADAKSGSLTIIAEPSVAIEGVADAVMAAGFVPLSLDGHPLGMPTPGDTAGSPSRRATVASP